MIIDQTQSGSLGYSGLFLPRDFSKVVMDLDGDDPLVGARPASGFQLPSIATKGRSAISFAQGTAGNQAQYIPNAYNGKGVIRTDGNDFYTASNSFTFGTSFTIFVVATPSSNAASYYYATSNATGGGPAIISKFTNGTVQNYEFFDLSPDRIILSSSATGLNICEVTQTDGISLQGAFNGVFSAPLTPTKSGNGFLINWLFSTSASAPVNFIVDLARIIIATPALTAQEATQIRRYLSNIFNIAVS
jgi:hypothetical protein